MARNAAVLTGSTDGLGPPTVQTPVKLGEGGNNLPNGFGGPARIEASAKDMRERSGMRFRMSGPDMARLDGATSTVSGDRSMFGAADNVGLQPIAADACPVGMRDQIPSINPLASVIRCI